MRILQRLAAKVSMKPKAEDAREIRNPRIYELSFFIENRYV